MPLVPQRLIARTIDAKSETLLTPLFWPPRNRMSDGDLAGSGMDLV
jgi:hypothetical protein